MEGNRVRIRSHAAAAAAALSLSVLAGLGSVRPSLASTAPASPAPAAAPLVVTGVSISPAKLTFGSQEVGTTSSSRTVRITNNDPTDLTFSGIFISQGDTADFSITHTSCPHILVAAASCTVDVAFRPGAGAFGPRSSTLEIQDDGAGSPQSVTLVGEVGSPNVDVQPSDMSFGALLPGQVSPVESVTVKNTGTAELTILDIKIDPTDDFNIKAGDCLGKLAGGNTCHIDVVYSPKTSQGDIKAVRTAVLTITDNDPETANQLVSLDGTVPYPRAELSTSSLSFPDQAGGTVGPSQAVTLHNAGTGFLNINSLTIAGLKPDNFTVTSNGCPGRLAPGQGCVMQLAFTPDGKDVGNVSALLTIADDDLTTTQTVALRGRATPGKAEATPPPAEAGGGAPVERGGAAPGGEAGAPGAAAGPSAGEAAGAQPTAGAGTEAVTPAGPRSLVEHRVTVTDNVAHGVVSSAVDAVYRGAADAGGYVENSETRHDAQGRVSGGHLTVRMPVNAGPLSKLVGNLGSRLRNASVTYMDVDHAAEVQDLRGRLAIASGQHDQATVQQLEKRLDAITQAVEVPTAVVDIAERGVAPTTAGEEHNPVVDAVLSALSYDRAVLGGFVVVLLTIIPFAILALVIWQGRRVVLRRREASGAED